MSDFLARVKSLPAQSLRPDMTLTEVICFCKQNPEKVEHTALGRAVLKAIKQGNTKRLRRFWRGKP